MKTFEAIKLSATDKYDPSKKGFRTEWEAWEYVKQHYCEGCEKARDDGYQPCSGE